MHTINIELQLKSFSFDKNLKFAFINYSFHLLVLNLGQVLYCMHFCLTFEINFHCQERIKDRWHHITVHSYDFQNILFLPNISSVVCRMRFFLGSVCSERKSLMCSLFGWIRRRLEKIDEHWDNERIFT